MLVWETILEEGAVNALLGGRVVRLCDWLTMQSITPDKTQNPNDQQPLWRKDKFKNDVTKKD